MTSFSVTLTLLVDTANSTTVEIFIYIGPGWEAAKQGVYRVMEGGIDVHALESFVLMCLLLFYTQLHSYNTILLKLHSLLVWADHDRTKVGQRA